MNVDDKDLWELELKKVTVCLVTDGSFGCQNARERYVLFENGALITSDVVSIFGALFYAPGTVPKNRYTSVTGFSFKALPLANKQPSSRTFFIEFESLASLSGGVQKRVIQQNAKVDETMMLNIKDDKVILDNDDAISNDDNNNQSSVFSFGSNMMIAVTGFAAAGTVMLVMFISFLVFRFKITTARKEILSSSLELETEVESEGVRYM